VRRLIEKLRLVKATNNAATMAIADIEGDGANVVIYACRDGCQSAVFQ